MCLGEIVKGLEVRQHVKLLGMQDPFKRDVCQRLSEDTLLTLDDGKVTLQLSGS